MLIVRASSITTGSAMVVGRPMPAKLIFAIVINISPQRNKIRSRHDGDNQGVTRDKLVGHNKTGPAEGLITVLQNWQNSSFRELQGRDDVGAGAGARGARPFLVSSRSWVSFLSQVRVASRLDVDDGRVLLAHGTLRGLLDSLRVAEGALSEFGHVHSPPLKVVGIARAR